MQDVINTKLKSKKEKDENKDAVMFCDLCLMLINREIEMTIVRQEFAVAQNIAKKRENTGVIALAKPDLDRSLLSDYSFNAD